MINPDEHFAKGSSGHEVTSQAVAEIERARTAGLTADADRLESNLEASIITLRKSGGKDINGFNTMIKSIGELSPQINAFAAKQNEAASQGSQIEASRNLLKTYGIDLPPEQVAAIDLAMRNNNISELKAFNSATSARAAAAIAEQIPATEAEQAKIDADKERA